MEFAPGLDSACFAHPLVLSVCIAGHTLLPRGPLVVHMGSGPGAPCRHPRVLCDLRCRLFASRAGIHSQSLAWSYGVARFRTSKPIETIEGPSNFETIRNEGRLLEGSAQTFWSWRAQVRVSSSPQAFWSWRAQVRVTCSRRQSAPGLATYKKLGGRTAPTCSLTGYSRRCATACWSPPPVLKKIL